MVLGIDIKVSKTTAHNLSETPGDRNAQDPRWPPTETEKVISRLILRVEPIVIPYFYGFEGRETHF